MEELTNLTIELRNYFKSCQDKDEMGILCVIVDNNIGKISTTLLGSPVMVIEGLGNEMERKEDLKRVLFAIFGSYLTQHPEDREMFIKSLNLVPNTPDQN